MGNALTGDFDALVLVRTRIVDGILARMHRNGSDEDASPSLLHSFTITIGALEYQPGTLELADWAGGYTWSDPTKTVEASLQVTPPGVLVAVGEAKKHLEKVQHDDTVLTSVRGKAKVQAGSPTVALPAGTESTAIVSYPLRARFLPSAGSAAFPQTVHGLMHATFHASVERGVGDQLVLRVAASEAEGGVVFEPAPGSGLDPGDVGKVAGQLRQGLLTRFEPTTIELEEGFPFAGFKGLVGAGGPVLACPVTLSGSPPSGLGSVTNDFLAFADDFGVAIAKELLDPRLDPMLDGIRSTSFQFELVGLGITWATYTVSVSSASLAWKTGELELTVQGSAKTGSWFPDYSFTVKQRLTLELLPLAQLVRLVAVGDPQITGLPGFAMGTARAAIVAARDDAIDAAQPLIQQALVSELALQDALEDIGGAPETAYTAVEIDPAGVVLRGQVEAGAVAQPVVHFEERPYGQGYSALGSWIPGGWIERFEWTWVEGGMNEWWGASTQGEAREHTFELPQPASQPGLAGMCLWVVGSARNAEGNVFPVASGTTCTVKPPSWIIATMPPFWDLFLPIWEHELGVEEVVSEGIHAHVNALAHAAGRPIVGANSIVHFPGDLERPREVLENALSGLEGEGHPLAAFLVLPRGALAHGRAALEKRLGGGGRESRAWIALTEDYESKWSRAFGAEKTPATFLLNSRGEFVCRVDGAPGRESLAELRRRLTPGEPMRFRQLRLAVEPGDRPPDVLFPYAGRKRMPLRRLRGRRVHVLFWKAWSAPCVAELRRLQELVARGARGNGEREAPVVVAVHGGEDPRELAGACKEHGVTLPVVADPRGVLARRYGVHCWPTTVTVGEDGRIERIQFGASRGERRSGPGSSSRD